MKVFVVHRTGIQHVGSVVVSVNDVVVVAWWLGSQSHAPGSSRRDAGGWVGGGTRGREEGRVYTCMS